MRKMLAIALISAVLFGIFAIAGSGNNERGPLEKVTFIHYKKDNSNGNAYGRAKPGGTSCYSFLSSGAKWKAIEDYLVNPSNSDALSESFTQAAADAGVAEWEAYAGNIFGNSSVDYTASYNNGNLDGKNTVSFGTEDPGVIAVTTVWGYFSGPPKFRELIEWDLLYNDEYFTFGDAIANPALMDLQNIATHELGHSAGLADLYNSCIEETMYGFSSEGETKKRTLNSGDIAGIQKLY